MKKAAIFLLCLILGPIFGCLASNLWLEGANTFWQPINYFPLAVNKIMAMKSFGKEFWVKTDDDETHKIIYPCLKGQVCWEKSDDIPSDFTRGNSIGYKISSDGCKNDNFVYPLLNKIRTCITVVVPEESPWTTSLALTEDGKLWIWDKPWESPYNGLSVMIFVTALGVIIGLFAGALFVTVQKTKENKNYAIQRSRNSL